MSICILMTLTWGNNQTYKKAYVRWQRDTLPDHKFSYVTSRFNMLAVNTCIKKYSSPNTIWVTLIEFECHEVEILWCSGKPIYLCTILSYAQIVLRVWNMSGRVRFDLMMWLDFCMYDFRLVFSSTYGLTRLLDKTDDLQFDLKGYSKDKSNGVVQLPISEL